jgi:hypothetical protein
MKESRLYFTSGAAAFLLSMVIFATKFSFESLGSWRENNKMDSKFPKEEIVK